MTALIIYQATRIADYHLTQTVFQNLALQRRDDDTHPWFFGPVMAHRNRAESDYSYFWQACKRVNNKLGSLRAFQLEDEAAIQGILLGTKPGTVHVL